MADPRWSRPCSLMGCPTPRQPHHHHYVYGHLSTEPCICPQRDQPGTDGPKVGEVWERIGDGKAPVTVERVWEGNIGGHHDRYVRCEPLRGGRWWFTTVAEFTERYRRSAHDASSGVCWCGSTHSWERAKR